MPVDLEELLQELENNWNGTNLVLTLKKIRSDESLMVQLHEVDFIRQMISALPRDFHVDFHMLDRCYNHLLDRDLLWGVFVRICDDDILFNRICSIHRMYQAADDYEDDESPDIVHEDRPDFQTVELLAVSQSRGHIIFQERHGEYQYELRTAGTAQLSDVTTGIAATDSVDIKHNNAICSVQMNASDHSIGVLLVNSALNRDVLENSTVALRTEDALIQPLERKISEGKAFFLFRVENLEKESVLIMNPALMSG